MKNQSKTSSGVAVPKGTPKKASSTIPASAATLESKRGSGMAKTRYDHLVIEKKWQKAWEAQPNLYKAVDNDTKRQKLFMLVEFPFPSGAGLHAGHVRSYTALDIIARKNRMEGKNVLYPIGWDAFGLPTENYAIKTGVHPAISTKKNTENFERQLKSLAFSFDWSRTVDTTDPEYYRWTQWIFLQFLKKDLAYRDNISINWCPKDKIGLANEEVVGGCCERCGTKVEKRKKEQWMLAITKYADRLDKDLDTVDYPDRVKTQQRNWIGKSEGAELDFVIATKSQEEKPLTSKEQKITVFTTRPDTLYGATYIVLAPEHELVEILKSMDEIKNWQAVDSYIKKVADKDDAERTAADKPKTGIVLEGVFAIHPLTNKKIPVWIADYVLATYGTGAIMAVPGHDERDFSFAKKYNLPIKEVVIPRRVEMDIIHQRMNSKDSAYMDVGVLIDSGDFTGQQSEVAKVLITQAAKGRTVTKYKLRDWVFSRQRYWGEPIPVVHCGRCFAKSYGLSSGILGKKSVSLTKATESIKPISINFYKKEIWDALESGIKTVETRALNPEEPHRYFGNIEAGDIVKCIPKFDKTGKKVLPLYFEVQETKIFGANSKNQDSRNGSNDSANDSKNQNKPLEDLFADTVWHKQIYAIGKPFKTVAELIKSYARLATDYAEKIKTNGLVAWKFKKMTSVVPLPEKSLPLLLPPVKKYEPTDNGESPLAAISSWVNTACPVCKGPAKRETDTMPNWAGSSWYYLRYADPKNKKAFADASKLKYWTPIDWYNGGMEHTTLHLLYSRFWHKFLFDQKLVPTKEPYAKRTSHGLIMATDGTKMSKSKGNVINPDDIIKLYGADTLRLFEMFIGPFEQAVAWNSEGLIGPRRFIERVFRLHEKVEMKIVPRNISKGNVKSGQDAPISIVPAVLSTESRSLLHKTIKKVSDDIESLAMNTAVSSLMILTNQLEKETVIPKADFELYLGLIAPFIPYTAEEINHRIGNAKTVHSLPWPKYNPAAIAEELISITVQINGKVRGVIQATVEEGKSESLMLEKAFALTEIKKRLDEMKLPVDKLKEGKGGLPKPDKIIFISGRVLNLVYFA